MTTLSKRSSSRSKQVRGFVVTWLALTFVIAAVTFFAVYLTYGGNETPSFARNVAFPSATPPVDTGAAVVGAVGTLLPTLEQAPPTATPTATPTIAPTEAPTEASADTAGTGGEARTVAQAATPEPTPTPQPAINNRNFQLGIQVQTSPDLNPENQDIWVRDVTGKLGMRWFKQQVRWEYIEPQQGQYDWNPVRLGIESAERFGSNIMLSVVTAPEWAREAGAPLDKHGPPADPQQFVTFVTAMINEFPGKIDAIEVWNEQNIDREWASPRGLIAADYVDLLRRTYEAVKAIDPNIIIISGALSPSGGWVDNGVTTAVDDFTYFDAMLDAGMLNYADCVGAHHNGYNIGPSVTWDNVPNDPTAEFRGPFDNPHHSWSFRSTLETYANRVQLKGGDQKLCVTEFGWASVEDLDGYPAGFEFAKDNTLEEQKTWTVEAVNNMRDWDIVWLAFLWNFNYGPQAGWDPSNDNVPYSIVGPDWVHRPVYDAIAEWSAQNAATQIGQ